MKLRTLTLGMALLVQGPVWGAADQPYAGQQARQIKALSAAEVQGYLEGKGMGFAKAAELNHYPGPLHVLEVADELALSAEQRQATEKLFGNMRAEARELGRRLVTAEADLDALFAGGEVDEASLRAQLDVVARIRAALRFTHLRAHLAQKSLLSAAQVERYDDLRGYTGHDGGAHAHRHHH